MPPSSTILLNKGRVTTEELRLIKTEAARDCECTDQMRVGYEIHGQQVTCSPCAARGVLNGIISLVKKLGD